MDDRDASLAIPASEQGNFGQLVVRLGWHTEGLYDQFAGTLTSVEFGFGRKQGGRRLWLISTSGDLKGPQATQGNDSLGAGVPPGKTEGEKVPLSDVIQGLAKKAGVTMQIDEKFGGIKREFWQQSGSFWHFMSSVAKEVGAEFQMTSSTTGAFVNPFSNAKQPHLHAIWGDNLIGWRIRPFVSRGAVASAKASFFQEQVGKWSSAARAVVGNSPFSTATAINALPNPAPNAQAADQRGWSEAAAGAPQRRGTGWVLINGEPGADVRMWLQVAGARPGVDGIYRVIEVEQDYSRHGGFTTRLTVELAAGRRRGAQR